MRNIILVFIFLISIFDMNIAQADATKRIAQFSNSKVNVWQTIIYPNKKQALKMHRHDYDRVVVAFDNGILQVIMIKDKHII